MKNFRKIIARYMPDEIVTYKEYRGKPYYSIQYVENGEEYVGFGTYNIDVLSEYLRKHFNMPFPEGNGDKAGHWIKHEHPKGVFSRECSVCNVWLVYDMPRNSFCPNCGADMRREEEECKTTV